MVDFPTAALAGAAVIVSGLRELLLHLFFTRKVIA